MDDIQISAFQNVAEVVIVALNDLFPIKDLGELSWYMGSEHRRDRARGISEISQTQFIHSVLNRFNITKNSSIPASPSFNVRYLSEDEPAVNVPFHEVMRSLMWISTQTRPDIANVVRVVARFSYDPKEVQWR